MRILGNRDVAASADAFQANYFRGLLMEQRSELNRLCAALTRRLTECMTAGEMTPVSFLRHEIQTIEWETSAVDRMLDHLDQRFLGDAANVRLRA
jgi:hypothetical protein